MTYTIIYAIAATLAAAALGKLWRNATEQLKGARAMVATADAARVAAEAARDRTIAKQREQAAQWAAERILEDDRQAQLRAAATAAADVEHRIRAGDAEAVETANDEARALLDEMEARR